MRDHESLPRLPANHVPLTPLSFLLRSARVYPNRVAVIHGARRFTYAEMLARCRRLASALAAAGAFSLSDAARLLKARGQAMQRAVPVGVGAMAALLGAELAQAEALCKEASTATEIAAVANDNAPGQVVISGHKAAIDRAAELVKNHGIKRAMMLPVSAPFHSPLMAPAADAMARALEAVTLNTPSLPVIANVTVKPVIAPDEIKALLVEQVTGRVRWRETIESLPGLGVTKVVEAGAGKVLTGMAKRITKDV